MISWLRPLFDANISNGRDSVKMLAYCLKAHFAALSLRFLIASAYPSLPCTAELLGRRQDGSQWPYGQCGGAGWTGPTICHESRCTFVNDYFSQCLPVDHNETLPPPPPSPPSPTWPPWEWENQHQTPTKPPPPLTPAPGVPSIKFALPYAQVKKTRKRHVPQYSYARGQRLTTYGEWLQCGGVGWTGLKICFFAHKCVRITEWYSQCLPDFGMGSVSATATGSSPSVTGG